MAYSKENKYWKIGKIVVNREEQSARVIIKGYQNKEHADEQRGMRDRKVVLLVGPNFPFVNDADPNQIALAYTNLAKADPYFADAEAV